MKIAVCISGLMQYWDITHELFKYWNEIYDDVDFVFFLSTWESDINFTSYEIYYKSKKKETRDINIDFSQYSFLEDVEVLSTNVISQNIIDGYRHTGPYYAYQLWNVQKMRKKYEERVGEKFDVVVQTREDMFISRQTLDQIIFWFNSKQIVSGMFFTTSGTKVVTPRKNFRGPKGFSFSVPNDNFSFAHPDAMDKFAQMYNDCYVEKTNGETFVHFMHAQQLMNKGIYNLKIGNKYHTCLIRTGKLQKKGFPTDKSLKKMIADNGVEWIYSNQMSIDDGKYQQFIKKYFN